MIDTAMNTEELHNITSNWQITDQTVRADPAKLKEAFEATQSEIANFWREVEETKKTGKSSGDQLRAILEMLRSRVQFLPLYSFEMDGTFVPNSSEYAGSTCGTAYNGNDRTLGHEIINDIHEKIWLHYSDRIESIDDFWPFRDFFFPAGYNFWESKEKTNQANAKIEQFLGDADAGSLEGFIVQEEFYALSEEMPDLYSAIIDRLIEKIDVGSLGSFWIEHASKLSCLSDEQFEALVAKAESADPATK